MTMCPVCESDGRVVTQPFEGYIQGWETTLAECASCELTYSVRRDIPPDLYENIYRSARSIPGYDRYVRYADEIRRQEDPGEWLSTREDPYRVVFTWLARRPSPGPILEIGSGLGYLTYALRRRGLDAVGVDVSTSAVRSARQRFNDPDGYLLPDDVWERYPDGFAAVIGLEIVEHVPNPVTFVRDSMSYLRPGGTLIMSTPNRDAFSVETLWDSDIPPVHLSWFGSRAMGVIAAAVGAQLEVIDLSSDSTPQFPISGANQIFEPFLTTSGEPTPAAENWTNRIRLRAGSRLVKAANRVTAGRHRLPGVLRPTIAPPTSQTLGVAMTIPT